MKKAFLILIVFAFTFADSNFSIKESNNHSAVIELNIGDISFEEDNNYHSISSKANGKTQSIGEPELPSYSFNYGIDRDKEYDVEINYENYTTYENINLIPVQPLSKPNQEKVFVKNEDVYSSQALYPENNFSVKRMSMRGYELLGIEVIPFEYNLLTKQLKVYSDIEVIITQSADRSNASQVPRSEIFEKMYKNKIINSDSYSDSRSFQKPSILYICGGNIASSSYFQNLAEWRHKQGYVVHVASLSETGSSTSNIKNYLSTAYNNWENPPEHVCFIGDADGSLYVPTYTVYGGQGWSSASGEGDFPYTLLEGSDLLPEMTVGRISVRSTSDFVTHVNKIMGYEKYYDSSTDWLSRMALVGDPYDSGISTIITNEYIQQVAEIHGGIDDFRTKYSGNNFDNFMVDQINEGVGYLNYRGFYGFSNFTPTDVNQLNNGYRLPFISTMTCGTGSFATETTCMTEELFRAGTSVSPKGAVAVIGTAQSYTHTAFNNIVNMGLFEGIFIDNAMTAGEATVYGKLALNEIYPQNPNDNVYLFATWNNLLGDPALQLWTSSPKNLVVQHDQLLINGSDNFSVNVSDDSGNPLEDIIVTLVKHNGSSVYDNDEIFMTARTNQNGIADFYLENYSSGTVFVTTRAHNYVPQETSFSISEDLPELTIIENSITIDDSDFGNGDGTWNPSEQVDLSFDIYNNSSETITGLNLVLETLSNDVTVQSNTLALGTLAPNQTLNIDDLSLLSSALVSDDSDPEIRLTLYSTFDDLLWNYIIPIEFSSGNLNFSYTLSSQMYPGTSANMTFNVTNTGSMTLDDLTLDLEYYGSFLDFSQSELNLGSIGPNQTVSSNSITLNASTDVINGTIVNLPISFYSSNGYETQSLTTVQVGTVSVTDPLGPDQYGYYIYDMNDIDYELAPTYNWVEIDPDYGGSGTQINLDDYGDNGDDVTTINLPFPFTFYGETYNEISVCSNGWISFGETDMESFRNYTLPGPGGPSPMVAVFWDDLKTTNGGEVYQYYQAIDDSFIIEWSNVRTFFSNTVESFQVILYNSGVETPTGDDEIKIQFKDFNNNSFGDYPVGNYDGAVIHGQYCTVGIENHLSTDGLQYTFNNVYPTAAMPLSDETAIFITTRGSALLAQPNIDYSANELVFNVPLDEIDSEQLVIENNGEPGSILAYSANLSPFASNVEQIDNFGYAWTQSFNNDIFEYDWIDISNDNEVLSFENNDSGTQIDIGFSFPFYNDSYNQCLVNPNGWIGFEEDNDEWNNNSVFDVESPRSAIFGFWDDLNPQNAGNDVGEGFVRYHSNNERLVVWFDNVVHWTSLERVYDFQMVLYPSGKIDMNYREMQGETASGTIGIIDSDGSYGIEVVYNDDFIQDELSLVFDTAPSWLSLDLLSGDQTQIEAGQSAVYSVNVNTENLGVGTYEAFVVINTNISSIPEIIPITLNTQEEFLIGDVNQDSVIDVIDIVRIVSIIMGNYDPSSLEILLSDVNSDETLNVIDIVVLVSTILSD